MRGNLEELARDRADAIAPAELEELERFAQRIIELRWSLLNRRALGGRVREGHGDLRCEHVSLADDSITIIDCVEFSEGLRYVDVASDIGFLAIDLGPAGARGLSDELVGAYREACFTATRTFPLLVPLYKFHRALVRAKVEGLTSRDAAIAPERSALPPPTPHAATLRWRSISRASRGPAMIVVCGALRQRQIDRGAPPRRRLGFEWLRSDEIRKRLAGVAPAERLSDSYAAGA